MASNLDQTHRNTGFFDCNDKLDNRANFIYPNASKQSREKKKMIEDIQLHKNM